MKHILFILLAAAGIATSLPSCEKWEFLEEHPKKVDATTFMSNAAEVLSESLADYCYGRGNYATSYATGLTSGGVTFTNDTWAVLYRAIRFSNEILSQIGDAKLSQLEYDHLSGEARFLRAFSYSYLARYYGAVPFFDEHNMHDFNKPRTPERDIWEFVAREAADAAALLPESVAQAGHPARYAALMLETEALLYLERWGEAAAAVGEVIDSDRYGLVEVSKADDYEKIYGTTANATREEIFYFKYNQDDGNNFMAMYLCRPNPVRDGGNVGIYTDYEKNNFVKNWDKADLRYQYNLWIQTGNGTLNSLTKTGMICLKFRDYNSTGAANDFPVYRYADACESTPTKVRENLARLWDEVKILAEPHAVELLLEPKQSSEPLLSKLNIFSSRPSELRVVFLHEHNAQTSAWVRGQDKGRAALVKAFPDKLYVSCRENVNPEVDAEQVLEEVAHDHADIVFTTSARMHTACLKVAAQHPKTRFLNCSLNAPHPLVRTYYPRTYEVTYLLGMLAGIVSHSDKVGYVAANPVYGVPAAINAFAQGVRAVRPDSRVVLRWACLCDAAHPQDFSDRKDIEVFYSQDFREPEGTYRDYGLCRRLPDGVLQPLGLPEWRWDVFFTEIVRSVFAGTWDSAPGGRAINYWWGLKSGAERVEYPIRLNDGTMQLLKMAERQLCDGEIHVFPTESYSQGHALHHAASGIYTPKELMEMDWLEECVEGELPSYDELDAKTRSLLNVNGLDIVKGTPQ